ncbi:hypothetical protein GGR57DRAFT_489340 [Xylariaceae sp. FL1272]|nr:hypothetical protein GGR57DRAFT_489340 [Xylariaceae sp. FL1272]
MANGTERRPRTLMHTPGANLVAFNDFCKAHTDTYPFISPEKCNFAGKSVFIAGASKGIAETAISFAKAGCSKIAIGARSDLSSLVEEMKKVASGNTPHIVSLELDVTSEDSVRAAAQSIAHEFGGALDVLICNAGKLEEWLPVAESKPDEWWRSYEVNLQGTYLLNRHFIPLLLKGEVKTSILTSSIGALMVMPAASAYQSAKLAVVRLAEFIAAENEKDGLVCYAIHPGAVKTELAQNMPKEMHELLVDEPRLPAHTIVWLSQERRAHLSGRFISINWDMEELEKKKNKIMDDNLLKFRLVTS